MAEGQRARGMKCVDLGLAKECHIVSCFPMFLSTARFRGVKVSCEQAGPRRPRGLNALRFPWSTGSFRHLQLSSRWPSPLVPAPLVGAWLPSAAQAGSPDLLDSLPRFSAGDFHPSVIVMPFPPRSSYASHLETLKAAGYHARRVIAILRHKRTMAALLTFG